MNHRKFWHKWEAHLCQPPKKSGLSHLLFYQIVVIRSSLKTSGFPQGGHPLLGQVVVL